MTSRRWCFTLNNPDGIFNSDIIQQVPHLRYIVFQEEISSTGTNHLQGYCELKVPVRIGHLRRYLDKSAHYEIARGGRDQCRDYCRKDDSRVGDIYEYGTWLGGGQGQRSDLSDAVESIKSGQTIQVMADKHPGTFLRYYGNMTKMMALYSAKRNWEMKVMIFIGLPGTGKSRQASSMYPTAYWKDPNNKWWDNYCGEKAIIVDDYIGKMDPDFFLRMLDRYPLMVECKNGSWNFQAETIIITTMVNPMAWYNLTSQSVQWAAIHRRVTEYVLFSEDSDPVSFGTNYEECMKEFGF